MLYFLIFLILVIASSSKTPVLLLSISFTTGEQLKKLKIYRRLNPASRRLAHPTHPAQNHAVSHDPVSFIAKRCYIEYHFY